MRQAKKYLSFLLLLGAGTLAILGFSGFKLEKDARELTETETVKAPTPEEDKKVKEGPPSPSYKMDSMDDFMGSSPLRKTSQPSSVKKKSKSHNKSRKYPD